MASLRVTLIDVGWGDSILIESEDSNGDIHRGLIDSNDTATLRCSYIFLKRYFERAGIDIASAKPMFEFVLLTHAHSDHGQGLKALMREFGTRELWYPKSLQRGMLGNLIRFANRSSNVGHHEAVEESKPLPSFGDAEMSILWPRDDQIDAKENNNSVVLLLRLDEVSVLLTGDAEEKVWSQIADSIPSDTRFFKVPHHGSVNGTFDNGQSAWLDECANAILGISSHVRPYEHPDTEVIDLFERNNREYYRTDRHYHVTFETNGQNTKVRYWH